MNEIMPAEDSTGQGGERHGAFGVPVFGPGMNGFVREKQEGVHDFRERLFATNDSQNNRGAPGQETGAPMETGRAGARRSVSIPATN